jgi:hypothetical protein
MGQKKVAVEHSAATFFLYTKNLALLFAHAISEIET